MHDLMVTALVALVVLFSGWLGFVVGIVWRDKKLADELDKTGEAVLPTLGMTLIERRARP